MKNNGRDHFNGYFVQWYRGICVKTNEEKPYRIKTLEINVKHEHAASRWPWLLPVSYWCLGFAHQCWQCWCAKVSMVQLCSVTGHSKEELLFFGKYNFRMWQVERELSRPDCVCFEKGTVGHSLTFNALFSRWAQLGQKTNKEEPLILIFLQEVK